MKIEALPVDAVLPELVAEITAGRDVVLEATPGAGKTTRVPPALARALGGREILVLEPRRLAAKMAAHRVAAELGEPIGRTVGYQFRFENVGGRDTRIRFLTEGIFIRRLLSDPKLERVGAVVVDEFHERHLTGDVALAALRRLQETTRPDLRLVVMSATLETASLAEHLGGARVIRVETRRFDVSVEYNDGGDSDLERKVAGAIRRLDADAGDVLVFLPGIGEIRRAERALEDWARETRALVLPLYGDLSREEQERALSPADRRKIILSTNVAETSLTIEGVRVVVDSGLARVASHSHWSGLPALRTRPVSRASAVQRAGRAGRTAPGHCVRLYSRQDFDARASFETPEIRRADLAQTLLELKALGVNEPANFPWFEPPLAAALDAAMLLLRRLGALDAEGQLTAHGRRMAGIPAHPRLARLIIEGEHLGRSHEACTLAAMLSERNDGPPGGPLDVVDGLERYRPVGTATRVRDQLLKHCRIVDGAPRGELRKAVLAAFPDRVARRRELAANLSRERTGRKAELVLASAPGSVLIEDAGHTAPEYVVTIDIEERGHGNLKADRICRSLCAIEPEWLFDVDPGPAELNIGVREESVVEWDSARERVIGQSRIVYGSLVLSESKGAADPTEVARVLAREAASVGIAKFCNAETAEVLEALIARVRFVRERQPDLGWPSLESAAGLNARLLDDLCAGKSSFAELRESDIPGLLLGLLPPGAQAKLEALAPQSVTLKCGRRVRVHYESGKDPWIESRLQDFFGMKTGPTVLGGRVPLVLHLLAPNRRAVQVTSDLAGFWTRNYPALRRELGRRYPRHAWPEDPLAAH